MTITLTAHSRFPAIVLVAALLAGVATAAVALQQKPAPAPAPVVIVPVPPHVSYNQSMREAQLRDQLQKNQLEEQLRQGTSDAIRRPSASDPAQLRQLDQADQSQRDRYRARQQDLLDRYRSVVAPTVVPPKKREPASSRSSDER
jgi:ABC-type sugar transport system substrate-binding protein